MFASQRMEYREGQGPLTWRKRWNLVWPFRMSRVSAVEEERALASSELVE